MKFWNWLKTLWAQLSGDVDRREDSTPPKLEAIPPESPGLMYPALAQRAADTAAQPLKTYRYCGVIFPKANYVYHYRTEDRSIAVGDLVLVPVFVHNECKEASGVVVSTGDHLGMSVPFPLSETSVIIRKLSPNTASNGTAQ